MNRTRCLLFGREENEERQRERKMNRERKRKRRKKKKEKERKGERGFSPPQENVSSRKGM